MKSRAKAPEGEGGEEKEDDEEKGEEEEIKPVEGSSKSPNKGENCFLIFLYLGCICGKRKNLIGSLIF